MKIVMMMMMKVVTRLEMRIHEGLPALQMAGMK